MAPAQPEREQETHKTGPRRNNRWGGGETPSLPLRLCGRETYIEVWGPGCTYYPDFDEMNRIIPVNGANGSNPDDDGFDFIHGEESEKIEAMDSFLDFWNSTVASLDFLVKPSAKWDKTSVCSLS